MIKKSLIKLGYCPTRRDVFSTEEAIKYSKLIKERISSFDIEITDLSGINNEELLFQRCDVKSVIDRMRGVDAIFFPHCNFGSESLVAEVAKALDVPVLLWGPRDDMPDENGFRSRDSQCGLFATGKVLRRHNVKFTYLINSWYDSDEFIKGFEKFIAVVNVVRSVKNLKILQISTRPELFCSVICNENELLERFGIQLFPITLPELISEMNKVIEENSAELKEVVHFISRITKNSDEEKVLKVAAIKLAMKRLAENFECGAVAIQCWNAFEELTNIMPCLSNSLLTDEGLPVVCETDILGAVTAVMTQAAGMDKEPQFFADITVRNPLDDNSELLWHCGNFPYSLAKDKDNAFAGRNLYNADKCYGICEWELKDGDITIARFDGDHGNYKLLIGEAKTTTGPNNVGSYVWIKVKNWNKWERKLVEGPYIHHVSGVYGKYGEILAEACKYLNGVEVDAVEPTEEELKERWD